MERPSYAGASRRSEHSLGRAARTGGQVLSWCGAVATPAMGRAAQLGRAQTGRERPPQMPVAQRQRNAHALVSARAARDIRAAAGVDDRLEGLSRARE